MGNPYAFTRDFIGFGAKGTNGEITYHEDDPRKALQIPCPWVVYIKYTSGLNNYDPLMGIQADIIGGISGMKGVHFVSSSSNKVVPLVGGCYSVSGVTLEIGLVPFSSTNNPYGLSVFGVPDTILSPDYEPVPVDGVPGNFGLIPDWSCGVSASPPFQTVEVLGVDLTTVVQTLVLGSYSDFAPLHPLGFAIRNTAVIDTLFAFKKKNYFG